TEVAQRVAGVPARRLGTTALVTDGIEIVEQSGEVLDRGLRVSVRAGRDVRDEAGLQDARPFAAHVDSAVVLARGAAGLAQRDRAGDRPALLRGELLPRRGELRREQQTRMRAARFGRSGARGCRRDQRDDENGEPHLVTVASRSASGSTTAQA